MSALLQALGYAADIAILGTYALLARRGRPLPFHWANAVGCVPLLVIEYQQSAWPVMPLTFAFGVIGAYGAMA